MAVPVAAGSTTVVAAPAVGDAMGVAVAEGAALAVGDAVGLEAGAAELAAGAAVVSGWALMKDQMALDASTAFVVTPSWGSGRPPGQVWPPSATV